MRLKDKFNIKTKKVKDHQHNITYYVECPEENCNENYVGEIGCRLSERVLDHNGRDKTVIYLNILLRGNLEFSILSSNYCKNNFCRKVAESLLMKEKQSTLNTQEKSIPLMLFN